MIVVLVDSSIWIEAARREGDVMCKVALEALLDVFEATWCSTVKFEVIGRAGLREREPLEFFFENISYRQIEEQDWNRAVELSWKMKDAGFIVPLPDLLIAALSVREGCRVYAKDKHFDAMREVIGIRLYQPGYGGRYEPDT